MAQCNNIKRNYSNIKKIINLKKKVDIYFSLIICIIQILLKHVKIISLFAEFDINLKNHFIRP